MSKPSLNGRTVVCFESRMAGTTAQLVETYGGRAISAPSMQETPLEAHDAAFEFAAALFAGTVDVIVFTTGVGTQMLIDALETRYDRSAIVGALAECVVVARGPKAVRALKENGVPVTLKAPEPNTWKEVLEVMTECAVAAPLKGKHVAIQEYGRPNEELNAALRAQGAMLLRVPIYRWGLPDDLEPLKNGLRLLIGGKAEVAVFTSRQQVEHVLQVAAREGWERSLRDAFDRTLVASIGPICSRALEGHDLTVGFEPERPKLRILIHGLAEEVERLIEQG